MSCNLRNVYSYDLDYFENALHEIFKRPLLKYELEAELAQNYNREKTRMFSDLLQFMKGLGLIDYEHDNSKVLLTPRGLRTIIPYVLMGVGVLTNTEIVEDQYFKYSFWLNLIDIDRSCIIENIHEHLKKKSNLFRDIHRRRFHQKVLKTVFGKNIDLVKELVDRGEKNKLDPYDKEFDYSLIFNDFRYDKSYVISNYLVVDSIKHHLSVQRRVYSATTLFLSINVLKGIIQAIEITKTGNFLNELLLEREIIEKHKSNVIELARGAGRLVQEGRGVTWLGDHYIYYSPKML